MGAPGVSRVPKAEEGSEDEEKMEEGRSGLRDKRDGDGYWRY